MTWKHWHPELEITLKNIKNQVHVYIIYIDIYIHVHVHIWKSSKYVTNQYRLQICWKTFPTSHKFCWRSASWFPGSRLECLDLPKSFHPAIAPKPQSFMTKKVRSKRVPNLPPWCLSRTSMFHVERTPITAAYCSGSETTTPFTCSGPTSEHTQFQEWENYWKSLDALDISSLSFKTLKAYYGL